MLGRWSGGGRVLEGKGREEGGGGEKEGAYHGCGCGWRGWEMGGVERSWGCGGSCGVMFERWRFWWMGIDFAEERELALAYGNGVLLQRSVNCRYLRLVVKCVSSHSTYTLEIQFTRGVRNERALGLLLA